MAFRRNTRGEKLPDVLVPGLDVVFVGTAPSRRSAAVGAYYAHPGNRFWTTLHEVGITPRLYEPHEYAELIHLGIGFTDMAKRASGMDHEIDPKLFEVERFEQEMRRCRPRAVAFTSKKAASVWMGVPTGNIQYGQQPRRPDFPEVFVLSSPSGAARRAWNIEPWQELARFLGRAKT
ncbi:mismatch-specific DNA-glycosylase [Parvibaculum sp.]|uniref:mismatch-specific DNA-glycosylase n=1 Tax=Parvibaculum sp. TaxID=2024848 RepID=UPI000C54DE64|nr:mismatch-specific DNA-glycosylase [Parvibaculum sp.]MAM94668.1 mismatch-specific DNA-glycosylase [Parvibaculum sp.]